MKYKVTVLFASAVVIQTLAALLQDLYDTGCIAGFFQFERVSEDECKVVFERYTDDDAEYIIERIPDGVAVDDVSLTTAAAKQLLAELTDFDCAGELAPMIQALRDGKYVLEGLEYLRLEATKPAMA